MQSHALHRCFASMRSSPANAAVEFQFSLLTTKLVPVMVTMKLHHWAFAKGNVYQMWLHIYNSVLDIPTIEDTRNCRYWTLGVPPVIFGAQDPSTEVSCVSLPPPPHRISFITIYILSLNTPKPVASMWQCIPYSNSKFCHSSEKYYPILLTLVQFLTFIWNRDIDMCLWYNSTPTYKACIAAGRN